MGIWRSLSQGWNILRWASGPVVSMHALHVSYNEPPPPFFFPSAHCQKSKRLGVWFPTTNMLPNTLATLDYA